MKFQYDELFQHVPKLSNVAKNNVVSRVKNKDLSKRGRVLPIASATIFIVACSIFLFGVIYPNNILNELSNGNGQPSNEGTSVIANDEQDDQKEKEAQIMERLKNEQAQLKKELLRMENLKNQLENETINLRTRLLKDSEIIYRALEQLDYETIASMAHPQLGVTFPLFADYGNPEGGVNGGPYVSFSREELLDKNGDIYQFGADNGDNTFEMSLTEYIQDVLITHNNKLLPIREISFNEQLYPKGGVINTIHQYYPEAKYVEYYRYESDDPISFQSLRFVYQDYEGEWYLTAIVRDVYSP